MTKSLLPTNQTALERAAAIALAQIQRVPIPIRDLWNPDTIHAELLPWLAWAFDVDHWDQDWPEAVKRQTIKNSFSVHKHKGTIASLRRLIEPLGFTADFQEWFQETPTATPGTFKIYINTLGESVDQETSTELARMIDLTKSVSRHISQMNFEFAIHGDLKLGAGTYAGEIAIVQPHFVPELASTLPIAMGGRDHTIEAATVWPRYIQKLATQTLWHVAGRDHTIETATVRPHYIQELTTQAPWHIAGRDHTIDQASVYPS